jgi:predicted ATPase
VVPTIAQTLGLREAGEQPLLEQLKASVREKQHLLLLDNFEQVVGASPLLIDLLRACPNLKMVVTSRAVLHVSGEHEFSVLPLAVPDLRHLPESDGLTQYAAVALFQQRALSFVSYHGRFLP